MKNLLIILGLFVGALTVNAQDATFGIKGGLNYAFINGEDILNVEPKFSYHAGAIVNISFTDFVALQPEFIFSVKGYDGDMVDLDLNYVDLPILLKVKLGDVFSLHAGPQFSYLLSSSVKTDLTVSNIEEQIESFDLGVATGFEYELVSGFSLGARYSFSVESIGKDYDQENVDPNDQTKTIIENIEAPDYRNGLVQRFAAFTF